MSKIKVDTWENSSGLENYPCTAWINFNGIGTVAIKDSGNVSSITDNSVGSYTINFTTPMNNLNYTVSAIVNHQANGTARVIHEDYVISRTTSQVSVHCGYISSGNNYTLYDHSRISVILHGGR